MGRKISVAKRLEHLQKPHFQHAYAEMDIQTDRGTAICGSALLDLVLCRALEEKLCDDKDVRTALFDNHGPLQGLSAKIHIAYALGVMGHQAYVDMRAVRDVRNAFAHSVEAFGFERDDVAELCSTFWFAAKIQYTGKPVPATARDLFIREIRLLVDGLISNISRPPHIGPDKLLMMGPPKGWKGRGAWPNKRVEQAPPGRSTAS